MSFINDIANGIKTEFLTKVNGNEVTKTNSQEVDDFGIFDFFANGESIEELEDVFLELLQTKENEETKDQVEKVEDKETFEVDDAKIYLKGEEEVEEMFNKIQMAMSMHLLEVDPDMAEYRELVEECKKDGSSVVDIKKLEAKCREMYAEEHPEYAAVMEQGQAIEKAYEEAEEKAEEKMIKELYSDPSIYMPAYYYESEESRYMREFRADYKEEHPEYATLRTADKEIKEERAERAR